VRILSFFLSYNMNGEKGMLIGIIGGRCSRMMAAIQTEKQCGDTDLRCQYRPGTKSQRNRRGAATFSTSMQNAKRILR
jgi:hypothetical protein